MTMIVGRCPQSLWRGVLKGNYDSYAKNNFNCKLTILLPNSRHLGASSGVVQKILRNGRHLGASTGNFMDRSPLEFGLCA